MIHEYKIWTRFFDDVVDGTKPFEVRQVDRSRPAVVPGDDLLLREYNPRLEKYTGRSVIKRVKYVLMGDGELFSVGYFIAGLETPPLRQPWPEDQAKALQCFLKVLDAMPEEERGKRLALALTFGLGV